MKKLTVIAALAIAMLSPAVSFGMGTYYGKCDVNASEGGGVFVTKYDDNVPTDDQYLAYDSSTNSGWVVGSSKSLTFYAYAKADANYYFDGWYSDSGYQTRVSTTASKYKVSVTAKGSESNPTTTTLYALFKPHTHSFNYAIDGNTITKTCTAEGCPGGVDGSATLTVNNATYTGGSITASVSTTGDASAVLSYNTSDGKAPTAAGTYQVTMAVDGGTAENSTITRDLVISPATIDSLTLDPASQNYDGTEKSTTMTVKAGSLTLGSDDYDITAGTLSGVVGSPAEDVTTTVTVQGKGNFIGTKSASWTVKAPSGSFAADALTTSAAGCAKTAENAISVTDSSQLAYVGDNLWRVSATITWPRHFPSNSASQGDKDVQYIDEGHAIINVSRGETALDIQTKDYKVLGAVVFSHDYINTLTWSVDIPLDEFKQAIEAGKTELVYDIELGALGWTHYESGIRGTTYQIRVPIDDELILNDADGRRVYPPHRHDWSLFFSDETLIAVECSDPDCPQGMLMLSLVADSWIYNGTTYSATLEGADAFRVHVGATVGEITYWAGETQLMSAPRYTGNYEVRVVAVVLGEPYVLRKQFSIYKPYDGYTDGWELTKPGVEESLWVRYDTYAEASAAASDGDTVIYHGDTINQKTYDFTSDADITVSFLGTRLRHDADGNSIFRNDGSGKVTLVNARVLQPKNIYGQDVEIVGTAGKGGAFVFGDGVDFVHQTTVAAGLYEMTLKVSNIDLEIVGGTYQIKEFSVGDGGSVSISGGKFWSDFNPSAYVAPGYGVREISGDYKYEVVETAEVIKDHVVDVTGGDPSEVEKWLSEKVSDLTAVRSCEYLKASFELDVDLITDATTVDITDFSMSGGFSFTITLNKSTAPVVIRAAAERIARIIRVADALGLDFAAIDAGRLTLNAETGRVMVLPKLGAASEFLKILIEKDNAN